MRSAARSDQGGHHPTARECVRFAVGLSSPAGIPVKYKNMKLQTQRKVIGSLSSVVKIGISRQVVIPKKIHDRLGLEPGDYLEVKLRGDKVILTPRALVEKRLAEALEDVKNGRIHGPFSSANEMVRSLRRGKRTSAR